MINCFIEFWNWRCLRDRATYGRTIMVMLDESHLYTMRQQMTRLEPSGRIIGLINFSVQAPPCRRTPCRVAVKNLETAGHGDEKIDDAPKLLERSLGRFSWAVLTILFLCLKTDGILPSERCFAYGGQRALDIAGGY